MCFHPAPIADRFDYWYQSNPACVAIPNFHLPYMGSAHQDEVTFVLGQPNFMEDGSCCGTWCVWSAAPDGSVVRAFDGQHSK